MRIRKLMEDIDKSEMNNALEVASITGLVGNLVKDEWEAVDGYNQAIVSLQAMGGNEQVIATLNDILSEEYVHIGQLEKTLQMLVPESNEIQSGAEEAEEDSEEDEEDEEDSDEEDEEEDWPEDDIPMEIANKINFDKGDEEEDD